MSTADPTTSFEGEGISDAVKRTLKGRYAAEYRFKAYGLIAIGLALGFLALLFADITSKGITAFVQTKTAIQVHVDPELVDPQGDGSLESLGKGNYRKLLRDGFKSGFASVKGRKIKKQFNALLSAGAEFEIREAVLEDPSLVGGEHVFWVTMSDDVDVLAKGRMTDFVTVSGSETLSPTGTEGEIEVHSSNGAFAGLLGDIKQRLSEQAAGLDQAADRLRGRLANIDAALQQADADEEAKAQLASDRESAAAEVDRVAGQVSALRARAEDASASELLDSSLPGHVLSINGGVVLVTALSGDIVTGDVIVPLQDTTDAGSGSWKLTKIETPSESRQMNDRQVAWYLALQERGQVEKKFNTALFTAGDSREPELAGIWGAAVGSFFTLLVTLILSFPIGVMTAVYLEEFAPKNRLTDLIEVNINNLAAVPSIVFGLLGLAVFLNFFGMPRSAPVVGGLVLSLMTLPTIIIAGRAALGAVPPSIREAAFGVGASPLQTVAHHVLPLAMPGMMTGTIIGMARALGETAPLLMIGMVAFIVDIPGGPTDPATALPVQIYIWADSPERAFLERTSAAILVLLVFMIAMNLIAILLRNKFERRW